MYIGSTGSRGLHHLVFEVVDNSVDEALADRADLVEIVLHPDNSVTVTDNGSGIPVDVMADQGLPAVTVVLTKLHAGGKFGGEGYKVSGGLHGVGVSVVNALSEWLTVEVSRDGKIWRQEFARGEPTTDLKAVGPTKSTGTTISFMPDREVFDEVEWQEEVLVQRLRETAFLTKGLRIVFTDERAGGKRVEFLYEGGIRDFVKHVNQPKDPLHKTIVYFEGQANGDVREQGQVEVAMQWNSSYVESVFSFANNINTHEGGSHLTGFRSALTATLNKYARDKGLLKEKEENLEGDDVREGLAAVISVKLAEPQFEGQTKTKLGNPWVDGVVRQTVNQKLAEFLEEHPAEARQIISKAVAAARARQAARKARDLTRRKSALESNSLPGRLADCQINDPEVAELFLVEGNSAGGSAVDARDRSYQAILPLRGKVINAEKNRINKVLSNEEIQSIVTAIGTGIGEEFDISKLRYNRVIVMTDADVDGAHIRTLILTFLYRQMPELVDRGHVYIAVAPLYRVKVGTQLRYVEKESQLEDLLVQERIKDMEVQDRTGDVQKLTETRYGRLARVLHEFDGWVSRLREDFGPAAANFVVDHRLVEADESVGVKSALDGLEPNGFEFAVVESDADGTTVRVVERETGAAASVVVPAALFASPIYANVRKTYGRLVEIAGQPPFEVSLGKKTRRAETFATLRESALDLAKENIQISRFKGLGEMDAEELADTTMDPTNRMLIRVEVEDAAAADGVFTMLMGDQVEPRRAFIEQNAKDVKFLDV